MTRTTPHLGIMLCSSTPEASLVSGPGGNECHCDCSNTSIVHAPLLYGGVEDPCLSFTLFHFFLLLSLPLVLEFLIFVNSLPPSFSLSLSLFHSLIRLSSLTLHLSLSLSTHTHTICCSSLCLSALPAAVSTGELYQHICYLWPGAHLLQHELLQMVSGFVPKHMQSNVYCFTFTVDIAHSKQR